MVDLLHFSPRRALGAKANLLEFISSCRQQSNVFGLDLDFDADIWDISKHIELKGTRSITRLRFNPWRRPGVSTSAVMEEPFKSFAKAYMRYQQGLRPSKSLESRLIALRALYAALAECGEDFDPTRLLPEHFDRTAQLIQERVKATSSYQYGAQLELIYETMAECGLLSHPQAWRSPIQRVEDASRIGPEFEARRISRLPSRAALAALAAIFHVAKEPSDVVVTAATAILCSAPERINEVLRLAVNSEVECTFPNAAYGLRWYPAKGGAPQVKWTIQSMSGVVRNAIAKLKRVSTPARVLARWYEEHPTQIYLPTAFEHLRSKEMLSMAELLEVLFESTPGRTVAATWCDTHKVPKTLIQGQSHVRFRDVEAAVLRMLPRGFPYMHRDQKLRFSEALFILRKNEMHRSRATYRCMFSTVGREDIYIRISDRYSCRDSIFEKFGYRERDGSAIGVRSHQFRHYLNTLANLGGMSQLDIAAWSGRARVNENKAYDHVSNEDVLQMMRDAIAAPVPPPSVITRLDRSSLIARAEFAKLKVRTAHTTDFGYCAHDFSMLPCMAHQDCLNCDEHFCRKGDVEKESRLRARVEETRLLLERAEEAQKAGLAGAGRWIERQRKDLERAEEVLRILQDPNVHQGAVIRISTPPMPSRLALAVQERQQLLIAPLKSTAGRPKRKK